MALCRKRLRERERHWNFRHSHRRKSLNRPIYEHGARRISKWAEEENGSLSLSIFLPSPPLSSASRRLSDRFRPGYSDASPVLKRISQWLLTTKMQRIVWFAMTYAYCCAETQTSRLPESVHALSCFGGVHVCTFFLLGKFMTRNPADS